MAKVDLELVKMVLTRNEVETRLVADIIKEIQQKSAALTAPPPTDHEFPAPVARGERQRMITVKITVEEQQSRDGGELHDLARKILCSIVEAQHIGQPLADAIAGVLESEDRWSRDKFNDAAADAINELESAIDAARSRLSV